MGIFGDVIQYIIDMGASVMLPIVIAILSIIVGVKAGKAIRCGHDERPVGTGSQGHVGEFRTYSECGGHRMAGGVPHDLGFQHRHRGNPHCHSREPGHGVP